MDARVFDNLTRHLGEQVPRRSFGGLLAVVLAMFGATEAVLGKRRGKADGRKQRRRHGHDGGHHERRRAADRVHDEKRKKGKKRKKKKKGQPQSPPPPGNASPPPPQSPPPPGGGQECPANAISCDGSCLTGDGCCETRFAECMGPALNDWDAAVNRCRAICTDREAEECRTCLQDVAETFAAPLANCLRLNCRASASRDVARDAQDAASPPSAVARGCNFQQLVACRRDAVITNTGAGGYEAILAFLDLPVYALGAVLLNSGKLWVDITACEDQYGCPDGECSPTGNVCCNRTQPCSWVGDTGACQPCPDDYECHPASHICVPRCKQCHQYLVDGREMPCGQITNNCGETLTCNGCPGGQRCVNRRCVACAPRRSAKRGQAQEASDECCVPQTCAELGVACGSHDDGCGETVQCGGCPSGKHCEGGVCTPDCMPKTCAEVGNACGALADGCGGTVSCGCPSGKQCEAGICKDLDPCRTRGCSWTGTFRQKRTFHGTGIYNEVTTLDSVQDVTYDIHADGMGSVTSTQSWNWRTDDPNICEHHVQYGGWDLAGHTESQVFVGSALGCSAPGSGGGCSFNYQDGGKSVTLQECTTCVSGTCCTPGCHEVGVSTTPGTRSTYMGVPTSSTHSGSDTYSEGVCTWGFCGTMSYEWTWNLSYGPIS